jgi:hypothetical protein
MPTSVRFSFRVFLGVTLLAISATASTGVSRPAPAGPSVRFVTPQANKVLGSTATFRVGVDNFLLDSANVSKRLVPRAGHIHFSMDGGKFDFPRYAGINGAIAAKSGTAGRWSPSTAPVITYSHLPPGRHTLKAMLANNLHVALDRSASVTFVVR